MSKSSNIRLTTAKKRVQKILDNAPQVIDGITPTLDPAIHGNTKALRQLCNSDVNWVPKLSDFFVIQHQLTQYERDTEVHWLASICDSLNSDLVVFPLAVSYFDRYLCKKNVLMDELRLVSSACFFLACKMKMAKPPRYDLLQITYSHLTTKLLFKYEMDISQTLEWDFSIPTPYEFYDQLLGLSEHFVMVKDNFTFAVRAICSDFQLACYSPQIQTVAAVLYCASIDPRLPYSCPEWFSYVCRLQFCLPTAKYICDQLFTTYTTTSSLMAVDSSSSYTYDSYSNIECNYQPYMGGLNWDHTSTFSPVLF